MTSMTSVNTALGKGADIATLHCLGEASRLVVVRQERASDIDARESLLDAAFGPARFAKTSEAFRAGRVPARGLSLVAQCDGKIIGTVRLWHVDAGSAGAALLLGPLAVSARHRDLGMGGLLMREAISRATELGHGAILLVGDEPYYRRFGFSAALTAQLDLPGPVDRARFLALELKAGAMTNANGLVRATGVRRAVAGSHLIEARRAA